MTPRGPIPITANEMKNLTCAHFPHQHTPFPPPFPPHATCLLLVTVTHDPINTPLNTCTIHTLSAQRLRLMRHVVYIITDKLGFCLETHPKPFAVAPQDWQRLFLRLGDSFVL